MLINFLIDLYYQTQFFLPQKIILIFKSFQNFPPKKKDFFTEKLVHWYFFHKKDNKHVSLMKLFLFSPTNHVPREKDHNRAEISTRALVRRIFLWRGNPKCEGLFFLWSTFYVSSIESISKSHFCPPGLTGSDTLEFQPRTCVLFKIKLQP